MKKGYSGLSVAILQEFVNFAQLIGASVIKLNVNIKATTERTPPGSLMR